MTRMTRKVGFIEALEGWAGCSVFRSLPAVAAAAADTRFEHDVPCAEAGRVEWDINRRPWSSLWRSKYILHETPDEVAQDVVAAAWQGVIPER